MCKLSLFFGMTVTTASGPLKGQVTVKSLMEPVREAKLEQLERLLQSRALHGSESLRAFLKYVVENAVDHREISLKEYTIATEVFGRDANYDTRNDSVVRVQAGRLRAKLHEYYASEGKNDEIIIDLPKGHYAPVFSPNPNAKARDAAKVAIQTVGPTDPDSFTPA